MGGRRVVAALTACAASVAAVDCVQGDVIYQTIARTSQPAPGTPAGIVYSTFQTPTVNDVGQVAFSANLNGSGITPSNDDALYAGTFASPQLVARAGSPAPGTAAGVNFASFATTPFNQLFPVINNSGQISFQAFLAGGGVTTSTDDVLYGGSIGSPQLIARAGSPAPGTPAGVSYSFFGNVRLNEAGQTAFFALLTGSGVTSANAPSLYLNSSGSVQFMMRDGDPAPGTGTNYGGGGGSLGTIEFNDAGQVVFWDSLSPAPSTANSGIFGGALGAIGLISREGDQAPDAPAGVIHSPSPHTITINNAGKIAYQSFWSGGGVVTSNDDIVYAGPMGSEQVLAREGDAAPGTPAGVNYAVSGFASRAFGTPVLNDAGKVAFIAGLAGSGVTTANDNALFLSDAVGTVQLVARKGSPAPGTPAGVNFSTFVPAYAMNEADQIATLAVLTGAGVNASNDRALYLFDPLLGAVLIAREGASFDIGGGVLRTIADEGIDFAFGRHDDTSVGLSDNGTLVFRLTFTNNTSGIFAATVPEPAGLSLAALACTFVLRRRQRA